MKIDKLLSRCFLVIMLNICVLSSFAQKPDWKVTPGTYSQTMQVVGVVYQNDTLNEDLNGFIGAFHNHECRGVANLQYDPDVDALVAYLLVYGDVEGEEITFIYYNSKTDKVEQFAKTVKFEHNLALGTIYKPYCWSTNTLNGTDFFQFDVPGAICSEIESDTINVIVNDEVNIASVKVKYRTSPGAIVVVDDVFQRTEFSRVDFSRNLTYNVTSGDGAKTKNYFVRIRKDYMTVNSRVVLKNSREMNSNLDTLYAIIDGVVRHKTTPVYDSLTQKHRYKLKVFGMRENQKITYKVYDNQTEKSEAIIQYSLLKTNTTIGSNADPLVLSDVELNVATIANFQLKQQIRSTVIKDGNIFKIALLKNDADSRFVALFDVAAATTVRVDGVVQYSGITENDFSKGDVVYKLYSPNGALLNTYSVQAYDSFMPIIARVTVNDREVANAEDTLCAIINGKVRERVTATYDASIKKYRFIMNLYNNDPGNVVTFLHVDAQDSKRTELTQSFYYLAGKNVGTNRDPHFLTDYSIDTAALSNFSLTNQKKSTVAKNQTTFKVVVSETNNRLPIVAYFDVPDGATVRVNGVVQYSGVTENDFSRGGVIYKIYSSNNELIAEYLVEAFSTSMNLTTRVVVNENEVGAPSDTLYAYINGILRDKISPTFDEVSKRFRFNMKIYNNNDDDILFFGYYNFSMDQYTEMIQYVNYKTGDNLGSQNDPFTLSDSELTTYSLNSISVNGQSGVYYKGSDTIKIQVPPALDVTDVVVNFNVDNEAIVRVGDVVQYSGITTNDFTNNIIYSVESGNGVTKKLYNIQLFSTSMDINSKVVIDSVEVADLADTLYASIDGVVRVKTTPTFDENIKKYRFNTKVFDNLQEQIIDFKYYSNKTKLSVDLNQKISFDNGATNGSNNDPYIFSNYDLTLSQIDRFSIKKQLSETIYEEDNVIKVVVPYDSDLTQQVALFSVDDGAKVKINGEVQYSDITVNDFSEPLTYSVVSGDGQSTTNYTVMLIQSTLDNLTLKSEIVSPDGDGINDYWVIENNEKFRYSDFFIYNIHGNKVFSSTGYNNDWDGTFDGDELPVGTYYFVIQSVKGILLHKGSIILMR